MNIKYIIIYITTLLLLCFSVISYADAPCSHIGQESLNDMYACLNRVRQNSPYMDTHNTQIVNQLGTRHAVSPQPYAEAVPYAYVGAMMHTNPYYRLYYWYPFVNFLTTGH